MSTKFTDKRAPEIQQVHDLLDEGIKKLRNVASVRGKRTGYREALADFVTMLEAMRAIGQLLSLDVIIEKVKTMKYPELSIDTIIDPEGAATIEADVKVEGQPEVTAAGS